MHRSLKVKLVLGSVLASLIQIPAYAQEGAETPTEEIVVTAPKQNEAVRAVAGSISAYSGADLQRLGAQSMEDYITRTPGVVFNGAEPGNATVTVRGISTGLDQGQGTTGYFINEVPLTDPGFSIGTPDIDTFDVDNVAILRGPQGTLFGSASLGGAVNYQARRPNTTTFDAALQASVESTDHGGVGDAERVMVNVPLITDQLAIRGVYYNRDIAGYIDNLGTGHKDANHTNIEGGRFQALWQPSANTTFNYLYLEQSTDTDDSVAVQPATGELTNSSVVASPSHYNTQLHNLRLDQDLGFATLTAMATHHRKEQVSVDDSTDDLLGLLQLGFGLTDLTAPVTLSQIAESKGDTFEVRLASAPGGRFDYVIGAMHDETDEQIETLVVAGNAQTAIDNAFGAGAGALLAPGNAVLTAHTPVSSRETAIFGEATWHFDDYWKLTVGGRAFRQELSDNVDSSGFIPFALGSVGTFSSPTLKEDGFNPKLSLTWTPSDDFMVYALVSKGFRAGGPNIIPNLAGDTIPANFGSDTLINYEAGVRSDWFDHALQLDLTAFHIDWSDIQLRRRTATLLNFGVNAGEAKVDGLEASVQLRLHEGLTWQTAATWLDASLSDDLPASSGSAPVAAGAQLPGAYKWQVSNVLRYQWSAGAFDPSVTLSHRHVSQAPTLIGGTDLEGGYNVFDARLHVDHGRYGLSFYVDNIGDERGVVSNTGAEQILIRPRTFGMSLDVRL